MPLGNFGEEGHEARLQPPSSVPCGTGRCPTQSSTQASLRMAPEQEQLRGTMGAQPAAEGISPWAWPWSTAHRPVAPVDENTFQDPPTQPLPIPEDRARRDGAQGLRTQSGSGQEWPAHTLIAGT